MNMTGEWNIFCGALYMVEAQWSPMYTTTPITKNELIKKASENSLFNML